jgi:hypothetical protein
MEKIDLKVWKTIRLKFLWFSNYLKISSYFSNNVYTNNTNDIIKVNYLFDRLTWSMNDKATSLISCYHIQEINFWFDLVLLMLFIWSRCCLVWESSMRIMLKIICSGLHGYFEFDVITSTDLKEGKTCWTEESSSLFCSLLQSSKWQ